MEIVHNTNCGESFANAVGKSLEYSSNRTENIVLTIKDVCMLTHNRSWWMNSLISVPSEPYHYHLRLHQDPGHAKPQGKA